jgi:hypothetical protein
MPRMLRDIVQAILATEPDIQLRASGTRPGEGDDSEALHDVDVAIVAADEMASVDYETLLYAHPRLRLVAIVGDGRSAVVYELHPTRVELGEFSREVLIDAIRSKPLSGRMF